MSASSVELLAPAGDFRIARAAFAAGADAVYCGLKDFSARAFAENLTAEEMSDLLRLARAEGKKVYVTFNTLLDEDAVEGAVSELALLNDLRPDGLIVQDLGLARLCRRHFPDLALHASTQLVAHNLEGVLALKDLGFTRVVLARELSREEITSIVRRCGVEIECFIHGALCYSLSGLCLFGAMEKGRSGNRGKCPYCCRMPYETERGKTLPFSMRDLRLGEDVRVLAEAGVASLKIEGRMKSDLYVASVTRHYRRLLDDAAGAGVSSKSPDQVPSVADLETVFSRRTTRLYFDGRRNAPSPIDPDSLGHLGTEIGTVKHVTKDRDGVRWLRFHTQRALERHDGLQFEAMVDGRHLGMGIGEMRLAISRQNVFEAEAGSDVEIRIPEGDSPLTGLPDLAEQLEPGMRIYCSSSQAVRRMFPEPSFRSSDYPGAVAIDLAVTLEPARIVAEAGDVRVERACALTAAKCPEKTFAAVEKAFGKLGGTPYHVAALHVNDPERLFAPMSVLNDVRRDLVEALDAERARARTARIAAALADGEAEAAGEAAWGVAAPVGRTLKIAAGQKIPAGDWREIVVAMRPGFETQGLPDGVRLALPVYTSEHDFAALRTTVKGLVHRGFVRWEAADLAGLRLLRQVGVEDITADWTLYAFNASALRQLGDLGVKRFVASPENTRENLQFLAESGAAVEFLVQQSTPLFLSLTRPAAFPKDLSCFERGGLWVTTRPVPRTFASPEGTATRIDLSWDPA